MFIRVEAFLRKFVLALVAAKKDWYKTKLIDSLFVCFWDSQLFHCASNGHPFHLYKVLRRCWCWVCNFTFYSCCLKIINSHVDQSPIYIAVKLLILFLSYVNILSFFPVQSPNWYRLAQTVRLFVVFVNWLLHPIAIGQHYGRLIYSAKLKIYHDSPTWWCKIPQILLPAMKLPLALWVDRYNFV